MREILAAIIPPAGPLQVRPITHDDGDTLRALVGGWLEAVMLGPVVGWINEEGRLTGLAPNPRATAILASLGWAGDGAGPVAGTVVLTGRAGPETTNLPESALHTLHRIAAL